MSLPVVGYVEKTIIFLVVGASVAGWTIAGLSVFVSILDTGNFLFEGPPQPGRPEEPNPYFHMAAIAGLLPFLLAAAALALARLRR